MIVLDLREHTPGGTPRFWQANAFCERLIGTMRRECLDWPIPLNERHLRWILTEWVAHYHRGRPHASLGPGLPAPLPSSLQPQPSGHHLPDRHRVEATPILAGLPIPSTNDISDWSCANGWPTTTEVVRMRAWDQGFPIRHLS